MKFTVFQHVPYESPGNILDWIKSNGYTWHEVNFYDHPELPALKDVDNLIIMGGPMNIYDDEEYSWLAGERDFLKQCILSGKKVLGICLGAQMIADALGAEVRRNEHTEIGWFKVKIDHDKLTEKYAGIFPDEFISFHWHGDTFDIPVGCKNFALSEATVNQAFIIENVAAIQFHPEMDLKGIKELVDHNPEVSSYKNLFVQHPENIIKQAKTNIEVNKSILLKFLDKFFL